MAHFRIENLTFAYPTRTLPSVCNLSIDIHEGEFLTVCGKSGSGKSTFLRLLKPSLAPHGNISGHIFLDDFELSDFDLRQETQKIGFVLQNPDNQIVTDKVWHELAFGLENLGIETQEIRARISETASFFGIQEWFRKNTSELSGGQKQLLNLASVMVMQPEILILDEPTSQLDPISASEFIAAIRKINTELGTTVILSEHRLEDVFPISDRVLILENGKAIALGTPHEVGKQLSTSGNDMLIALPTPIRIHEGVDNSLPCPLTVREGREWLNELTKNTDFLPTSCATASENQKNATAIEMREVFFRYEKNSGNVLNNLSLSINQGEIHAIIGGNGAGKSTALSLMCGTLSPQHGSVKLFGENISNTNNSKKHSGLVAMLPQNPTLLFTCNTVLDELLSMPLPFSPTEAVREARIKEISTLCEITHLLSAHPYDLSGGEQQRVALAKLLILQPKILLLDEPTKGLDAHFKEFFAGILKRLTASGVTVVLVTHDIEFCAKHVNRVSMFFDGSVTSSGNARQFFANKNFYTTAANRMARHKFPHAVTAEDVIEALGGQIPNAPDTPEIPIFDIDETNAKIANTKKVRSLRLFLAFFFLIISCVIFAFFSRELSGPGNFILKFVEVTSICSFFACLLPGHKYSVSNSKSRISRKTVTSVILTLIAAFVTIYIGIRYLGDRKYYIISLLLMAEATIPFLIDFEGRRPSARELTMISVLCAIAVASRSAFFMIPQFKPLCAIIIIVGATLGCGTGFLTGMFSAFVSNIFFGQGPWTPWQMITLAIIGFLAGVFFQHSKLTARKFPLAVFGAFAVFFIYGGIMNPASVLIWQPNPTIEMFILAYVQGVPFDLLHAASTAVFLLLLSDSMSEKIERIKTKYGILSTHKKNIGGHK